MQKLFSSGPTPEHMLVFLAEIGMPAEVNKTLQATWETQCIDEYNAFFVRLLAPDTAKDVNPALLEAAGKDGWPIVILAHLAAALHNEQAVYAPLGISHDIFIDTMKCFPRFVNEHRESFGVYGFDRSFWTWRQVCGLLFRLGTLEFEMTSLSDTGIKRITPCPADDPNATILSVHIPSDAALTREALDASYRMAGPFFARHFPGFHYALIGCSSWMLAPRLTALLPEGSGILRFQSDYDIRFEDAMDDGAVQWVFKRKYEDLSALPEDTSLQRGLKALMLDGGHPGSGAGVLTWAENPYTEFIYTSD